MGEYNFNNISAAIAIGHYFNVSDVDVKTAIENYIPENNRSQIINQGSNTIILDAYNANPTSMAAALSNFNKLQGENKIAILGDMFELGAEAKQEHRNIAEHASNLNIDKLFLVGGNFYNSGFSSSKVQLCQSFEVLKKLLLKQAFENCSILVKGSRGMALERVLELI
jgi:UDP-N-acetylmuramoyl-tripeptide--D-alanyl-D-alanine ligase